MNDIINPQEFIWAEKYRPKTVNECILPKEIKSKLNDYIKQGEIQNFIFNGRRGTGKTSTAMAIVQELNADVLFINASMENGIDTLRNKVQQYASSVSFSGGTKIVVMDEADYLNAASVQPALRGFIQEFSKNCRFIFTCNYKNRFIDPLRGRFKEIDFVFPNVEKPALAGEMYNRTLEILKLENIKYDKKVIIELISKHFPDFRTILILLQDYASSGTIDSGILVNIGQESFDKLFEFLKDKNFTEVRKWVGKNSDMDSVSLFRNIYDNSVSMMEDKSIPQLVITLAEYQYRAAFVADSEINIMAALTEVMANCNFK